MGQLRTFLSAVKRSEGRTFVISGEGGVGKTRLLAEITEWAAADGWRLAAGSSYAVETGIPYALFSDAFLPLPQDCLSPSNPALTVS